MTQHKKTFRRYLPAIIGGIIVIGAIFVIVNLISNMEEKPAKKEKKIQAITLAAPPPPPPPPPKVERPPDQEPEQKIDQPEPKPIDDEPPPGPPGPKGDGEPSANGTGAPCVGNCVPGGRAGGGGGDPLKYYGATLKREINEYLADKEDLTEKSYSAWIKVWIEPDGTIVKFELAKSSNDTEIDTIIKKHMSKFKKISEPAVGINGTKWFEFEITTN